MTTDPKGTTEHIPGIVEVSKAVRSMANEPAKCHNTAIPAHGTRLLHSQFYVVVLEVYQRRLVVCVCLKSFSDAHNVV